MQVIYAIRHIETGRLYVGSAVDLVKRRSEHRRDLIRGIHKNPKLQAAWNKHGEDSFSFEVLEEVADKATLLVREQAWMDEVKPHYNIRLVAGSGLGIVISPEHRAAISKHFKGKPLSAEHREKVRQSKLGHVTAPETRAAISKARAKRTYKLVAPSGEAVEITNMVEFCEGTDLKPASMYRLANATGYLRSYKGWTRPTEANGVDPDHPALGPCR